MGRVIFKTSVGFVAGALILLAVSLYLSNYYLREQQRLAETGDLPGARDDARRAAWLDPFSPDPLAAEAYLYLRQGQTEAAAATFQEAIRREPPNIRSYIALGDLQRQQLNDPEAAAKSYQGALDYNPHATSVISRLGEALLSSGEVEEARAQYEWLRERGRIPFRDLYTLGKIRVRLGEPEAGIEAFEEAREEAEQGLDSLNESELEQREAFVESLDLAVADALVVQELYDEAREVLSESTAEQAPAVLSLLEDNPESYRESVIDAPIN